MQETRVSVAGLGRSPGGGNDNPLQHSCLENPMDRGACRAPVHGITKSLTWLSTHAHTQLVSESFTLPIKVRKSWCSLEMFSFPRVSRGHYTCHDCVKLWNLPAAREPLGSKSGVEPPVENLQDQTQSLFFYLASLGTGTPFICPCYQSPSWRHAISLTLEVFPWDFPLCSQILNVTLLGPIPSSAFNLISAKVSADIVKYVYP